MTSAEAALLHTLTYAGTALTDLRTMTFEDLEALPVLQSVTVDGGGRPVELSTYRETMGPGKVMIVVQLLAGGSLGAARIYAAGFTADRAGNRITLAPEDLYDFT
jgi:hypothetical protein